MRINTKYIRVYPWHSINLVPQVSLVMTYNDEVVPERHGCMLEIVVLGYVFHVDLPFVLERGYSTSLCGPLWSKKRKLWYKVSK